MSADHPNLGTDFDVCHQLFCKSKVNMPAILENNSYLYKKKSDKLGQIASFLRVITCIDLTTLGGEDTECNVQRLCHKAENPIGDNILNYFGIDPKDFHVAAVCVYPARIQECVKSLKSIGSCVPVAAVAAGFPSAQFHLNSKIMEIRNSVIDGADEIDIVISRDLVIRGEWEELYEEVKSLKSACGKGVTLKTIIAGGELGSLENVYKASIVSMAAGSDFIKTSTGKESINATLPIGKAMVRAIRAYCVETGFEVGFKPAGGIRTSEDALLWQTLMEKELGSRWLCPSLFRIGASGLLSDIEQNIFQFVSSYYPSKHIFPYQ